MEQKTKVNAEAGKQDVTITREFDLPVALLFKAYAEADLVAQWMGTNVLKLDSKNTAVTVSKQPTRAEIRTVFTV